MRQLNTFLFRQHKLLLLLAIIATVLAPLGTVAADTRPDPSPSSTFQGTQAARIVINTQTGHYNFMGFNPDQNLSEAASNITSAADALNAISPLAGSFGLTNAAQELQLARTSTALSGGKVYRYQQYYNGVPVMGAEIVVTTTASGRLAAVSGEASSGLSLPTTPGISASAAQDAAIAVTARGLDRDPATLVASPAELWIYDAILISPFEDPAQLVWRTEVTGGAFNYLVLIGAQRGGVKLAFNQLDTVHTVTQTAHTAADDVPTVDVSKLPAISPNYNAQAITFDSNHTPDLLGSGSSTLVCNWTQGVDTITIDPGCDGTAGPVSPADAAQYFAINAFNYYDTLHQRNSINNAGMMLLSNVNYREDPATPYDNAFWDGAEMVYGDADFYAADDVVAHELSHGVTDDMVELFYYYEAGALSEMYSDVFGEFADQWNGIDSYGNPEAAADLWLMAEDLSFGPFRDAQNPGSLTWDLGWAGGPYPDRMRSPNYFNPVGTNYGLFGDQGGVHINATVGTKTAYLIAAGDTFNGVTVTGIGNAKTSTVWYESYNLITSGADYTVFGAALNQACQNLIGGPAGITAADCTQVQNGTIATQLHLDPLGQDGSSYRPKTEPVCPSGEPTMLFEDDMESGTGNFVETDVTYGSMGWGPTYWYAVNSDFGISYAVSGVESLYGSDDYDYVETYASMASDVALTGGARYYLYFDHAFAFEDYYDYWGDPTAYDGALLEYTTDGGVTWQDAGALYDAGQDYNVEISTCCGNPRGGSVGFGYDSHGYVSTRYNLTSLAGENVNFRWVIAADEYWHPVAGSDLGWFIDNVTIYSCGSEVRPPDDDKPDDDDDDGAPGGSGDPVVVDPGLSKIGVLAPGALGIPGEQVTWTLTAYNPTGAALPNVVVVDTLPSTLRIDSASTTKGTYTISGQTVTFTIPSLEVGETVTMRVVTTVLSSPVGGLITNTATLSSGTYSDTASASVSVISGLPQTGYPPRE